MRIKVDEGKAPKAQVRSLQSALKICTAQVLSLSVKHRRETEKGRK